MSADLHPLTVALDPFVRELMAHIQRPEQKEANLLTKSEAADLLHISEATVDKLTKGKNCRRRMGRRVLFDRAGLLALMRRG